jgi:hypothetical protein
MPDVKGPYNCPRCGRTMQFVDAVPAEGPLPENVAPADHTYFTYECETHGRFHFGAGRDWTPGLPPTVS